MKKIIYNTVIMAAGLLMLGVVSCEDEAQIPDVPTDIHTVTISQSSLELTAEDTRALTAKFNSVATFQKGFRWTNSDPSVVEMEINETDYSCRVTALKLGEATLTLESLDGTLAANCRVVVNKEPFILRNPLYINFFQTVPKPWNNLVTWERGTACNKMEDAAGNKTEISIEITSRFPWGENNHEDQAEPLPAAYAPLTVIPEDVSRNKLKNDRGDEVGVLKLTGMRVKQKCHISFFCTLKAYGDVYATKLIVKGREEHTLTILSRKPSGDYGVTGEAIPVGASSGKEPAEANTTVRVGRTPELYPDDNGSIEISVTGGKGGNQPDGMHFISAMWIDPIEEPAVSDPAMDTEDFGATPDAVYNAVAANLKVTLESLTTPGNYVVNVTESATLSDAADNGNNIVLGTAGVTISLRGNGSNTLGTQNDASILRITGGKLILRDIALSKTGNKMPTVFVTSGGTFVTNEGVSIIGTGSSTNAGVNLGGHFHMKGGEIRGHRRPGGGAGVSMNATGTFVMDDGKIFDNQAQYAGGIFVGGGSVILNGGEFYDNHSTAADEGGGAVYLWGANSHFETHPGAVIYGENGEGGKAGNTATNAAYGHAVTAFYSNAAGAKFRSNTIQNETLSVTINAAGNNVETTGTWSTYP